jgi:hypothetical protein
MKKIITGPALLIYFLLLSNNLSAQHKEDVIYLHNGTVIHGLILKDSISSTVRILNRAGDTWVFQHLDIDSITSERPFEYKARRFNQRGFEFNVNAELMMRSNKNAVGNAVIPGMNLLLGYRFNPYLSVGTGFGMEFYDWMEIPITASVRLRTSFISVSPFLFLTAGGTIPAEKRADDYDYSYKSRGGPNATIGFGVERILNENTSFLLSFSYHYQELNYHLSPLNQWVQERDRTETYSRFLITLGYVFK